MYANCWLSTKSQNRTTIPSRHWYAASKKKGFVGYKAYGNTYQYYPLISANDYKRSALNDVIAHYYDNSFANVVSSFVEEEGMPLDELKALIAQIESKRKA